MSNEYHVLKHTARWLTALLLCVLLVPQADAQDKGTATRVDHRLTALLDAGAGKAAPAQIASGDLSPAPLTVRDGKVLIDAVASGSTAALAADLAGLGMENIATYGRYVSGWLPISAIGVLEGLGNLQFARSSAATNNVGLVTSQGDASMNSDDVKSIFGIDGTGVKMGMLSDSYDCLGGAATDVGTGDLPAGVTVLDDSACPGTDEGRAMMQLGFDVAPGTALSFHTAFGGQADFALGIEELAGCPAGSDPACGTTLGGADPVPANNITDDVIYFAEPMFQDGIIAQAIDVVEAAGVAYYSSAGNNARDAWEDTYRSSGIPGVFGGIRHDFDPGPGVDDLQGFTLATGVSIFVFQWDEPAFSVSGAPGSASDMDIVLYIAPGIFSSLGGFAFNIGGDAIEVFGVSNSGPPLAIEFGLELFAGPPPGFMKYVFFGPSANAVTQFATSSGSLYGHANAKGAEAVGAARYDATPAFGVSPPGIEFFSSAGPTPILFTTTGTPTFELRPKPEITAPDGTNNTFFGFDYEPDGFPNFFGTSAAAPHAAGAAALLLQANPTLTPAGINSLLETTAIDMDDPFTPGFDVGFDFGTGFGLIDAFGALVTDGAPPQVLWPPNHKYNTVTIPGDAFITSVSSDEPENGKGDGNTVDDIVIVDCQTVDLRAERSGKGNGRVYTVDVTLSGGGTGSFQVTVPHSVNGVATDDGPDNSVASGCTSPAGRLAANASDLEAFETQADVPEEFSLEQNYPNPFNPVSTIAFSLPESSPVELAIFDVMGRRIDTLVDGVLPAGRHEVRWEARALPTGVYFYRITAGDFMQVKQMMLVK